MPRGLVLGEVPARRGSPVLGFLVGSPVEDQVENMANEKGRAEWIRRKRVLCELRRENERRWGSRGSRELTLSLLRARLVIE